MTFPTPLPRVARFESLAYGLFLHWGLYSQLGRGEWIRHLDKSLDLSAYDALAKTFTAADFDARAIARTAREAGMRYIVLTTRHHDGFSLYDTRGLNQHDAPHSAAGRDLIAEFVAGCREEGIVPFFYHTTLDWIWESRTCDEKKFAEYIDYLCASVEILCTQYGEIGGLWFDGNWSRHDVDWQEDRLYRLIRSHQPEAMIFNNSGLHHQGAAGNPELDGVTYEQGLPKPLDRRGAAKYLTGEMCQTFNAHWGIGFNDFNYLSPAKVIENLCLSRRAGANYLLNVGPTATGAIPDYEAAALKRCGEWVNQYASALYDARPCAWTCQGRDFVLRLGEKHYYFAFDLSTDGDANVSLRGGGAGPRALTGVDVEIQSARWLDNNEALKFTHKEGLAALHLTGYPYGSNLVVRVAELS